MLLLLLIAAVIAVAAYYHFQQSQKAGSGSGSSKKNDVPTSCVSTANQPGTVTCAAGSVLPQSVTAVAKSTDSDIPQKPSLTESTVNRIEALPATTPEPTDAAGAKPSDSATSASASSGPATPSSGGTPSKGSKKKRRTRRRKKSGNAPAN